MVAHAWNPSNRGTEPVLRDGSQPRLHCETASRKKGDVEGERKGEKIWKVFTTSAMIHLELTFVQTSTLKPPEENIGSV